MHGLMQAKGWRWAAWRHRGGKGAAEHKIRMLECLWRRGPPLCGNQEWWLILLTVVAQVSAKHGNVVEIRGGGRGVSPAFGKRHRSGFANQDSLAAQYIPNTLRSR